MWMHNLLLDKIFTRDDWISYGAGTFRPFDFWRSWKYKNWIPSLNFHFVQNQKHSFWNYYLNFHSIIQSEIITFRFSFVKSESLNSFYLYIIVL